MLISDCQLFSAIFTSSGLQVKYLSIVISMWSSPVHNLGHLSNYRYASSANKHSNNCALLRSPGQMFIIPHVNCEQLHWTTSTCYLITCTQSMFKKLDERNFRWNPSTCFQRLTVYAELEIWLPQKRKSECRVSYQCYVALKSWTI